MTLSCNHFDHQLLQLENVHKYNLTHPWLSKVEANSDQTLYTQSRFSSDRTLFSLTWDKDKKTDPVLRIPWVVAAILPGDHFMHPQELLSPFHLTQWTDRDASSGIRYTHIGTRKDGIQVGDYVYFMYGVWFTETEIKLQWKCRHF